MALIFLGVFIFLPFQVSSLPCQKLKMPWLHR